nr:uncharacterized protein LOC111506889 [Leptinotarsa decemlineata]
MVSLKFIVVACTLLVAQTQAHPQPAVKGPFVDFLKWLVPEVKKDVDAAFNEFELLINDAVKDANKFQKDIVVFAGKALDKSLDLLNSRLDKIKAGGDQNTAKVINCIEASRSQSKEVALVFIDTITKCDLSLANQVLKDLSGLEININDIKEKVFAAANEIQKCSGEKEVECALDVAGNVIKVISDNVHADILLKIVETIKDAVKVAKDFVPKCVTPNLAQHVQQGYEVLNSVSACIVS